MKIAILGFSGSGKSTLARRYADYYQIPCLHLDTVQFISGWQTRPDDEAKEIVKEAIAQDSWVIDGNYRRYYQAERLARADQIVILLFPRLVTLKRIVKRYWTYRGKSRPDMAEGCPEKLDWEFLWWILHKGRTPKIRKHYLAIQQQYPNKTIVIRRQAELDELYHSLRAGL